MQSVSVSYKKTKISAATEELRMIATEELTIFIGRPSVGAQAMMLHYYDLI